MNTLKVLTDILKLTHEQLIQKTNLEKEEKLYEIERGAITEVIFGCNADKTKIKELLDIIKKDKGLQHVKLLQAKMVNYKYDLVVEDYKA
jgi:hypothetical protein